MSDYGYDRRGSRRGRARSPEYVQETTYVRSSYAPQQELVYRGGREDSIEDIPRDFPPPGGHRDSYAHQHQRSRSVGRNSYDPEAFYYQQQQQQQHRGRRDTQQYDRDGYYSDDYERPRNARRKSVVDQIKEAGQNLGLGGVIGAVTGKAADRGRSRSESRPRHDDRARSRSRADSRDPEQKGVAGKKWEQAAKAAILAGAVEAFRSRKEPGKWTEGKGQRVATAAFGAAGLDGFLDKDPSKKEKRHIAQSAIGGLVANRIANGPRSKSRDRGESEDRSQSRSRSRSRARSIFGRGRSQSRGREEGKNDDHTVRNVAGAGAALAAGKALYDRMRSKSRSRKERAESVNSEDSYVPSRGRNYNDDRRRSRSKSVGGGNRRERSSSTSTTDYEQQRRKLRGGSTYSSMTYADANPYSAVPPPPMGGGMRY